MFAKLLSIVVIGIFLSAPAPAELLFSKKNISILSKNGKTHVFSVEVAENTEKQQLGLMFRKSMKDNHGMLFLFDKKKFDKNTQINMWMKDTYIPLDIIFIKPDGTIRKIATGKPLSLESIQSGGEVGSVLEINAGMCKKLGININDKVIF